MREAMRFGSEGPRTERPSVVPLMLERAEKNIDFISPRLRAKLAEASDSTEEETPRSAAMPLFAIAAALVVIAVGVLLLALVVSLGRRQPATSPHRGRPIVPWGSHSRP